MMRTKTISDAPEWLLDLVAGERLSGARLTGTAQPAGEILDRLFRELASAKAGARNITLNRAAFTLGALVRDGALDGPSVRTLLIDACRENGLADDGLPSVEATIDSGLTAGAEKLPPMQKLQGRGLDLPEPKPWTEPVDGDELLDDLTEAIRRHVVMTESQARACALWVVMSHGLDALHIAPRLALQSAEKGSGKTTLLDVVERLVPRPLRASNVSAAAIFRVIESSCPTLLLDEADSFIGKDREELRGVLDSSHSRSSAYVIRTVGKDFEARKFSTWAAIAFAGIGKLPGTLQDRSVVIELKRARPDERVEPFRADRTETLDVLGRKVARWAADHRDLLTNADPEVPEELFNRQADNWRPLIAIANLAGGEWPELAREAARELSAAPDDDSHGVRLLADIREIFEDLEVDKISSADLCYRLAAIEDSPWPEYGRSGKPITPPALASLLRPYKIAPGTIRLDARGTPKGYRLAQFRDAFARYLPPRPATPPHARDSAAFSPIRSRHKRRRVAAKE